MYADVRALVMKGHTPVGEVAMGEGVKQGCPASPLIFSLFMDRVEAWME
jgi:hypothetical protein